jgi:hypothetical protein
LPNVFSVQFHAMRILWDKLPQIVDALEPGGSGDMYAGLTAEEREALAEVTRMGFPPRAWFDAARIATSYASVWSMLGDKVIEYDPTYLDDFWTVPGYLGADPTASLARARIQHKTSVVKPIRADEASTLGIGTGTTIFGSEAMSDVPVALQLADVPHPGLMGSMLSTTTGTRSTPASECGTSSVSTGRRSTRSGRNSSVAGSRWAARGRSRAAASPARSSWSRASWTKPRTPGKQRGTTTSSTARKVRAPTIVSGSGSSITRCT